MLHSYPATHSKQKAPFPASMFQSTTRHPLSTCWMSFFFLAESGILWTWRKSSFSASSVCCCVSPWWAEGSNSPRFLNFRKGESFRPWYTGRSRSSWGKKSRCSSTSDCVVLAKTASKRLLSSHLSDKLPIFFVTQINLVWAVHLKPSQKLFLTTKGPNSCFSLRYTESYSGALGWSNFLTVQWELAPFSRFCHLTKGDIIGGTHTRHIGKSVSNVVSQTIDFSNKIPFGQFFFSLTSLFRFSWLDDAQAAHPLLCTSLTFEACTLEPK